MANIAWAYGICEKHGVDTKDLEPWEVIKKAAELSKEEGARRENLGEGLASAVDKVLGGKKRPKLSKSEYMTISKIAIQKYGGKKLTTSDYTYNDFVVYEHLGDGDIIPICKLNIERNHDKISKIERLVEKWKN